MCLVPERSAAHRGGRVREGGRPAGTRPAVAVELTLGQHEAIEAHP
jgi:hypothetical protein